MARKFFEIFPPPTFLLMPAVGLSISEDAIRYVQFKDSNGSLRLVDFGEEKLPAGSIVEGAPVKTDKIVEALRKLKREHKISFANVALPEDKAYVFKASVSVPKGANITDSVGFILEENIPLSPAETVFDFSVVKEDRVASTDEVVVSAFPQETVDAYLHVCAQAGIKVLRFDIESVAVKRAVMAPEDNSTRLIVNFTGEKAVLSIVSNSFVQFVSIINPAADLSGETVKEHVKSRMSEPVEHFALLDEIRKVCSYFQSGISGKGKERGRVESIILTGDFDAKVAIDAYISKHTRIPTTLANVWSNAFSFDETIPDISFEDSLRYASAIGLALPFSSTPPLSKHV